MIIFYMLAGALTDWLRGNSARGFGMMLEKMALGLILSWSVGVTDTWALVVLILGFTAGQSIGWGVCLRPILYGRPYDPDFEADSFMRWFPWVIPRPQAAWTLRSFLYGAFILPAAFFQVEALTAALGAILGFWTAGYLGRLFSDTPVYIRGWDFITTRQPRWEKMDLLRGALVMLFAHVFTIALF